MGEFEEGFLDSREKTLSGQDIALARLALEAQTQSRPCGAPPSLPEPTTVRSFFTGVAHSLGIKKKEKQCQ